MTQVVRKHFSVVSIECNCMFLGCCAGDKRTPAWAKNPHDKAFPVSHYIGTAEDCMTGRIPKMMVFEVKFNVYKLKFSM